MDTVAVEIVTIGAEIAEVVAVDTVAVEIETIVVETAEVAVETVVKEQMMVAHLVVNTKEAMIVGHSEADRENPVDGAQRTSVAPVVAEI
ncbi:MAG: Uncharacterised protein [Marine Group II euryarchaeote MED-G33]|nr:MAG: Uncharacterised protein [Marine Group II euryarchaeote MED-G33]